MNKEYKVIESGIEYNVKEDDEFIFWYLNGKQHREAGPATHTSNNEYREWYRFGQLHRLDGPAIISPYGGERWFIEGKEVPCESQEEFEQYLKLKAFW